MGSDEKDDVPPGPKRVSKVSERRKGRLAELEKGLTKKAESFSDSVLGAKEVQIALFARGKIYTRYIKCGKKDCRCKKGGKGHGPYHYLVLTVPKHLRKDGPRNKWFYITKEEADEWRERMANYKKLQTLVWEHMMETFG